MEQRLIDAIALKEEVMEWIKPVTDTVPMVDADDMAVSVITTIEEAPTVDPVKHGKWEEWSGIITVGPEGKYHCSLCGGRAPYDYDAGFHQRLTDWCPGCGAKMDEDYSKRI